MIYVVTTIHVIVCIFLILVVLLQQGKGADLSVFGGGSTQTAFGARGAATLLHKLTVFSFVLFILTTMSIAFLQGGAKRSSVMGDVTEEAPAAPAPATSLPAEATTPPAGEATAPQPGEATTTQPGETAPPAATGDAPAEGATTPPAQEPPAAPPSQQ